MFLLVLCTGLYCEKLSITQFVFSEWCSNRRIVWMLCLVNCAYQYYEMMDGLCIQYFTYMNISSIS